MELEAKILGIHTEEYECLVLNITQWPNFRRYNGGIFERLVGDEWAVPVGSERLLEALYKKAGGKRS